MSNSIKANYFFNVCYQIFLIIAPLITTPYVSRVLLPEGIGEYSYAESIVTYCVLFAALGTVKYGQREVSYNQDNREQRSMVFWNIVALRAICSIIMLAIYITFSCFQENSLLYLVLSLNIASVIFDVSWLYQGMERFKIITIRNIIIKTISIILIFVLVRSRNDVALYALIITGSLFIGNLVLWFDLRNVVDAPNIRKLRPFRDIREVLSLFVPAVAISIYTVLDRTMIGVITGDAAQNGYYDQALKISKMTLGIVTSLGMVMASRIGHHFAHGEDEALKTRMYQSYRFVWMMGFPLCFGLIGISANLVPWFFGPGYEPVIPLLRITSVLILAVGINNATGIQFLIPTKRQNIFTLTVIVGALVNFGLNLVLIPVVASTGAAIASVAAETAISITQLVIMRHEFSIARILRSGWRYGVAAFVMLMCVLALASFLPSAFWATLLLFIVGVVVYASGLFLLRDEFFIHNLNQVMKSLRRR